ncbi:MAG: hypothetical protein IKP35_02985 [Alphaproteobacteria bacterium]|nr:hypothetical protein [Alphaproteobacteria bacterium]
MLTMLKKWLIEKAVKIVMFLIAIGVGIWYLSSSIGGASLSYTSVDLFMKQVGATDGDVSTVNGCFLCTYLEEMFAVMGRATEMFWNAIVSKLWILMAIGFGLFIIFHTIKFFREQAGSKDIKDLTNNQPKVDFKKWFDKVWKTGLRVLIAGALLGAVSWTGTSSLRAVTNITVTPVMYVGSQLSMAATGVISGGKCEYPEIAETEEDVLNPVLRPFMCVMGNLNTVMLAGAAGGFALMNYSWLGLGGGLFTWIAGLTLVILFLVLGFNLLFQVLTVVFKLVFVIIFAPLIIGAGAFEEVWNMAKGIVNGAFKMIIDSAISILKISLKIVIIYAVVYFAADKYYPEPEDGFTSIMPPLLSSMTVENPDSKTMAVMNAFSNCEQTSINGDGEIDKDAFVACFKTQKSMVEARYPGAFDFMDDGFDFLIFMIGIFFLYFWVVSPKIDNLIGKLPDEKFDYGGWVKDAGKTAYNMPGKIYDSIRKSKQKKE